MPKKLISACIAVALALCMSAGIVSAENFVSANHILSESTIEISGVMGADKGIPVTLAIAPESAVKDGEEVLDAPFCDNNKPALYYITVTGEGGNISEGLKVSDDVTAGAYYIYATSANDSKHAKFFVLDSDESAFVLNKFNAETNHLTLASYLSEDKNIEKVGYPLESTGEYLNIIADYTIFARGNGSYTIATLQEAINRAIALGKAAKGIPVSTIMSEYATAFGGSTEEYQDLSSDEKANFNKLFTDINYKEEGVSLEFDDLVLIAKARTSAESWSSLNSFMVTNADVLGIDVGTGSVYDSIPLHKRPDVFSDILSSVKAAVTISSIADAFDTSVNKIYKEIKKDKGGNGGGSLAPSGGSNFVRGESGVISGGIANDKKGFTDTANHFSKQAVDVLYAKGIVNGYGDGTFRPDYSVTRAEFAKMICSAFEIEGNGDSMFVDVNASDWYAPYVNVLAANKIILGDNGSFRPNDKILRQDAALIIKRALMTCGLEYESNEANAVFEDYDLISDYAKEGVAAMYEAGVVIGSDNNFYPTNNITRGEAAVITYRAFNLRMGAVQ